MAEVEEFKGFLQKVVEVAKENKKIQEMIKRWVRTYVGKIMAYKADGEEFYVVVTDDGSVRLEDGEYPSPDLYLMGDAKTIWDVAMGKQSGSRLAREGKIGLWGNWHEYRGFREILRAAESIISKQ